MRRPFRLTTLLLILPLIGACELLQFAAGKGKQEALYTFGKDQRLLVFVDVRDGVSAPPAFPTNLADKIAAHLFRNKAIDHLVRQDRIFELQQSGAETFKKLGIADIARLTQADVVLHVDITRMTTSTSTDGTVAEGDAEAYVKVISANGERLWPGDALGVRITAHMDPGFTSDRDVPALVQAMLDLLALRTGRMFHSYSLENRAMLR